MNLRTDIDEIQANEKYLNDTEHLQEEHDYFMARFFIKRILKSKGVEYKARSSTMNLATSEDMELAGGVSE